MNINKLRVGGHDITVKYAKLENDLASFDWNTNTITICDDIPESQKEASLLHEIMHVLVTSFDDGMGHAFMDSLSQQLYQVMKDNNLCFCKEWDCKHICPDE